MKRIVYIRCNGGHLYRTNGCPFDGWGSPETVKVQEIAARLGEELLSVEVLRKNGVADDTLRRVIIIEFGHDDSIFDALAPSHVYVDGQIVGVEDIPLRLM